MIDMSSGGRIPNIQILILQEELKYNNIGQNPCTCHKEDISHTNYRL